MSEAETQVLAIIAKHARRPAVDVARGTTLEELNMDSLNFVLCLLAIQTTVGGEILDIDKVGSIKTVEDILSLTRG
jgi:acyl carrier protein